MQVITGALVVASSPPPHPKPMQPPPPLLLLPPASSVWAAPEEDFEEHPELGPNVSSPKAAAAKMVSVLVSRFAMARVSKGGSVQLGCAFVHARRTVRRQKIGARPPGKE